MSARTKRNRVLLLMMRKISKVVKNDSGVRGIILFMKRANGVEAKERLRRASGNRFGTS
jgi:hypothetical protein